MPLRVCIWARMLAPEFKVCTLTTFQNPEWILGRKCHSKHDGSWIKNKNKKRKPLKSSRLISRNYSVVNSLEIWALNYLKQTNKKQQQNKTHKKKKNTLTLLYIYKHKYLQKPKKKKKNEVVFKRWGLQFINEHNSFWAGFFGVSAK